MLGTVRTVYERHEHGVMEVARLISAADRALL
jgi:hypothetical protein